MKDEKPAMPIDIDISEIEWKLSNKDGGGPAGPNNAVSLCAENTEVTEGF